MISKIDLKEYFFENASVISIFTFFVLMAAFFSLSADSFLTQRNILNLDDENNKFYFVHSYHAVCNDESNVFATSEHGYSFTSGIINNNTERYYRFQSWIGFWGLLSYDYIN